MEKENIPGMNNSKEMLNSQHHTIPATLKEKNLRKLKAAYVEEITEEFKMEIYIESRKISRLIKIQNKSLVLTETVAGEKIPTDNLVSMKQLISTVISARQF